MDVNNVDVVDVELVVEDDVVVKVELVDVENVDVVDVELVDVNNIVVFVDVHYDSTTMEN
jgi:hypothetical protein